MGVFTRVTFFNTIQNKLLAAFLGLTLIPIILLSVIAFSQSTSAFVEKTNTQNLQVAYYVSQATSTWLSERKDDMVTLAGTARVRHGYLREAGTGLMGQYTGSLLSVAWPALGSGETPITSTAIAQITSGIVRFYHETGAPNATKGTQYGTSPNQIIHNGSATVWTGSGFTPSLNVQLAVGDYVTLDDNGSNVLHTRVAGFQAIAGQLKVLVLEDSLPAALRGAGVYFNVTVGEIATIDLTNSQLTTSPTTIAIPAGLTAATVRTSSAYPVVGATLTNGTNLGLVYANYTASLTITN